MEATIENVTTSRDELLRLVGAMPDDQVAELLARVRSLTADKPKGSWPPKFVGMLKGGPADGSTAVNRDGVS